MTSRFPWFTVLCSLTGLVSSAQADTQTDLLLIIGPDGQSYTAQHTLSTDESLLVLQMPDERVSLLAQFTGPEKQTFATAHAQNPNRIAVWSGMALTRYRHSTGKGMQQLDDNTFQWQAMPPGTTLDAEDASEMSTTITWLLPDNATLLAFTDEPPPNTDSETIGRWQTSGNTLSYAQSAGPIRQLSVTFQLTLPDAEAADACETADLQTDDCAPDVDHDGVPDYRDICLPESTDAATSAGRTAPSSDDDLGCNNASVITLAGVQFQSGQSYLDVASRDVLDRVAIALQRVPDQLFEVSSHTDNGGRVATNQRLSENRADAVRHYMMLRGVGPNQLNARGYGETSPAFDNAVAAGRRANRRIELRRLN